MAAKSRLVSPESEMASIAHVRGCSSPCRSTIDAAPIHGDGNVPGKLCAGKVYLELEVVAKVSARDCPILLRRHTIARISACGLVVRTLVHEDVASTRVGVAVQT